MPEVIARRELIAVTSSGERLPVTIELGKPVSSPRPNENWECHLSVTPPLMHRPMDVRGYDALQALCFAISLANPATTTSRPPPGASSRNYFTDEMHEARRLQKVYGADSTPLEETEVY